MSAVLLICLATFALLMRQSEGRVKKELADTVSTVGRATLGAIQREAALRGSGQPRAPAEGTSQRPRREILELRERSAGDAVHAELLVIRESEEGTEVVRRSLQGQAALDSVRDLTIVRRRAAASIAAAGEPSALSIFVHRIVTETDSGSGALVMKIPALEAAAAAAADSAPSPAAAGLEEISVAVSTADYDALFAAMRRRVALVFCAVLAAGIALSVWLARRITRPIRAMDRALDALGRGDLDARVAARGNDELARLGTAFNRMADSLRSSRERERRLVRREKLTALGRLAAGVAHDVRNPIHSVGLTLQHVEDSCRPADPAPAAELDRSLALIRDELRRVDRLVGSFLRFAQNEPLERESVALDALVHDVVALIEARARRASIAVVVDAEAGPAREISVDAEAIRTSILNLALNAIDAMPQGGELRFELSRSDAEATLVVADSGRGIAPEHLQHIFDFGWTSRDEGHGLGLAVVHQIVVERHGGRVDVRSDLGAGSRFTLALPFSAPQPEAAS